MKSLNDYVKKAYQDAYDRGFYDPPKSDTEALMLVVTELAEAVECIRKSTPETAPAYNMTEKPEGLAYEVADAVIRLFDFCGHKGYDLEKLVSTKMDYNSRRPWRNGRLF